MNNNIEERKAPSARVPLIIGLVAALILVGGFGTWAVQTRIAGAIIASGQLEVDQNRQIVQHLDGGVVDEVLVEEGDVVEAGQLLLQLDPTVLASELAIVEGQYFEIKARSARVKAERDNAPEITFDGELLAASAEMPGVKELIEGQRRLFNARLTSLEKEVDQLGRRAEQIDAQISGIDAQLEALTEQLALIDEELVGQQSLLDKGLAQAGRVLALQRERARLSGTIGELAASRAEAEGRTTEIEIEILKLETSRREESITRLRDLQFNQLELAERRQSLKERLSRLEIRAPVSGVVYGMTVNTPRAVIRPAEAVLYLIPQDRPLVIATQVDPLHVDQVSVGQTVYLRFSALDMRTTPELQGLVTLISPDAFVDERTQMPYYRAEVRLVEGEVDKLDGQPIIPGMPVEAYLTTSERTPLAYLVKPMADYFNKAFRES